MSEKPEQRPINRLCAFYKRIIPFEVVWRDESYLSYDDEVQPVCISLYAIHPSGHGLHLATIRKVGPDGRSWRITAFFGAPYLSGDTYYDENDAALAVLKKLGMPVVE